MGSHVWVLRQEIRAHDGETIGTMRRSKTFVPYPGMKLKGYGLFADPAIDQDGDVIDEVWSVDSRTADYPDYFVVNLPEDESEMSLTEAKSLYSSQWEWTDHRRKEQT